MHAFEPQSLVFSILQNNLLLNNCFNVLPKKFVISNSDNLIVSMKKFSFNKKKINSGALSVDKKNLDGDLCLTKNLDFFNFEKIDFIKIDVQGSELNVLNGAEKIFTTQRPFLYIEMEEQYLKYMGASTKMLMEKIFKFNYSIFRIESAHPSDHICVPNEKINNFKENFLPKFSYKLSKPYFGKNVSLEFKNKKSNIYESILVK